MELCNRSHPDVIHESNVICPSCELEKSRAEVDLLRSLNEELRDSVQDMDSRWRAAVSELETLKSHLRVAGGA